jgi:cobalt-precorrin 5A hydrolase
VAGIGCRAGVSGAQVLAAIDAAVAALVADQAAREATSAAVPLPASTPTEAAAPEGREPPLSLTAAATGATGASPCGRGTVTAIATPAAKAKEPGIQAAAAARGVPLLAISQQALEAANAATVTYSTHSMAAMNVHSVAEAAALAGATTKGMHPRLLQPRVAVGPVTCALADTTTS